MRKKRKLGNLTKGQTRGGGKENRQNEMVKINPDITNQIKY